jgi:superfamily II DNA or RNA helicase
MVTVKDRLAINGFDDQAINFAINALAKKFPEHNLSNLFQTIGYTVQFARGFLELRARFKEVEDLTVTGPLVEIDYDESKLDERVRYQKGLLEKALAHNEGLIVAPTGAGKTVIETMLVCRLKRRALILTHTSEIAKQISDTFERLTGVKTGTIYGGVRDIRPVTVGLIQSVRGSDPVLQNIGTLVIDEAHHCSAPSYLKVLSKCPAKYRYGLTATIKKTGDEERIIYAALGPVLGDVTVAELQESGHLNAGVFRAIYTTAAASNFEFVADKCWYYKGQQREPKGKECPAPCTYPKDDAIEQCVMGRGYFGWIYSKIGRDEIRNRRIVDEAVAASKDHPWMIVLTHRKEHAKLLEERLKLALKTPVWMAIGPPDMKKKARDAAVSGYREQGGILVATSQILGEGFDAPKTSCLVRAMPAGGKVAVRQQTGRAMRPQERPSLIIDFVDNRILWLKRMWMGRRSIYKTLGFVPEKDEVQQELF